MRTYIVRMNPFFSHTHKECFHIGIPILLIRHHRTPIKLWTIKIPIHTLLIRTITLSFIEQLIWPTCNDSRSNGHSTGRCFPHSTASH